MNDQKPVLDRRAAEALAGSWRRFGHTGPSYEILGISDRSSEESLRMQIRVLHTNEMIDYRLSDLLQDPRETWCSRSL